jgi:hypothetical protein
MVLATFVAAAPFMVYAAPSSWQRLRDASELRGVQGQCMLYQRSSGEVVYDNAAPGKVLPECWTKLMRRTQSFRESTLAVPFLHERTVGNLQRLVGVAVERRLEEGGAITLSLGCYVVEPAALNGEPAVDSEEHRVTFSNVREIKLFGGQIDPADTSRFWIKYETDESEGVIEGRLTADERVQLTSRSGPTVIR